MSVRNRLSDRAGRCLDLGGVRVFTLTGCPSIFLGTVSLSNRKKVKTIREAINKAWVLGSEPCKRWSAKKHDRQIEPLPKDRPRTTKP